MTRCTLHMLTRRGDTGTGWRHTHGCWVKGDNIFFPQLTRPSGKEPTAGGFRKYVHNVFAFQSDQFILFSFFFLPPCCKSELLQWSFSIDANIMDKDHPAVVKEVLHSKRFTPQILNDRRLWLYFAFITHDSRPPLPSKAFRSDEA